MTSRPEDKQPADSKPADAAQEQDKAAASEADPADDLVTTRHSITIDGEPLAYTVTTGRLVLRLEGNTDQKFQGQQAKAEVFVTAYTADSGTTPDSGDAEAAVSRPVTFAFNGGP